MDPITACTLAYSTVKGSIALYKDLKSTGGDLIQITGEIGGALSKFFHGQEQVEQAYQQAKVQRKADMEAGRPRNLTMEAIDNVIRVRQIRQWYKDLEHMVRWELGMPDLWHEIVDERDRLTAERDEAEAAKLKAEELARRRLAYLRERLIERAKISIALILAVATVVAALVGLMMWVDHDRRARWPDRHVEFFER